MPGLYLKAPQRMLVNGLIGSHSCPSQRSPAPSLRGAAVSSRELHAETQTSASILFVQLLSVCAGWRQDSSLLNNNDVQEAEENELQRAGERTRISRQRRLFPVFKVRQLQDYGLTDKLLGGLQLQDTGLLWWDAAEKLKKGEISELLKRHTECDHL